MFLRGVISTKVINIVLDMHYGEILEKESRIKVSEKYTDELQNISISKETFLIHSKNVNQMLESLDFESFKTIATGNPIFKDHPKIQRYLRIGEFIYRTRPVKWYLLKKVRKPLQKFEKDFTKSYLEEL
jgi:hypothetical protein